LRAFLRLRNDQRLDNAPKEPGTGICLPGYLTPNHPVRKLSQYGVALDKVTIFATCGSSY